MFAKRDEDTVTGCDEAPKEKDGDKCTEGTIVSWNRLFLWLHGVYIFLEA
jgi:hypothetical protein